MNKGQIYLRWVCLFILVLLIGGFFPTVSANNEISNYTVCIDPGHGGSDPGAVNIQYGLNESTINLDVSKGIAKLLSDEGFDAVLTREIDIWLDNEDRYTFCNNENADYLISVHTNSVVDPSWDGSLSLYFRPDQDDQLMAATIQNIMYTQLHDSAPDPAAFVDFGLDWFASGVLIKSNMPGVILEPVFMSNPEEAALLVQPIFENADETVFSQDCINFDCRRGEIAKAIFSGLLFYIQQNANGIFFVDNIDLSVEAKTRAKFLISEISIINDQEESISDAIVSIEIKNPDGSTLTLSESTDLDGKALFRYKTPQSGIYEVLIKNIEKENWLYDPTLNNISVDTINIP